MNIMSISHMALIVANVTHVLGSFYNNANSYSLIRSVLNMLCRLKHLCNVSTFTTMESRRETNICKLNHHQIRAQYIIDFMIRFHYFI